MFKKLNPNIVKYYIFSFFGGFYFLYALQGVYPLSRGITILEMSWFVSLIAILTTALEIPTGFIADRFSRKISVSLGLLCDGLAYISYLFIHNFGSLIPVIIFTSLGASLKSGAMEALVYDNFKDELESKNYMHLSTRSMILGSVPGATASFFGPILYSINFMLPFIITASFSFVMSALALTFREERKTNEILNFKQSINIIPTLLKNKSLRLILVVEVILMMFVNIFYQFLYFPKISQLGMPTQLLGSVDVVNVSIMALVLYFLPKMIFKSDKKNLVFFTLAVAVLFVFFSNSSTLVFAIVFGVLFDIFWTSRRHVMPMITNKFFEEKSRATSLSGVSFMTNIGAAILIPLATAIFTKSYLFAIIPTVVIILLLIVYPSKNDI